VTVNTSQQVSEMTSICYVTVHLHVCVRHTVPDDERVEGVIKWS